MTIGSDAPAAATPHPAETHGPAVTAREVRVLEGPNLYFRRPAVKVVLDVTAVVDLPAEELSARVAVLGWRARPGRPRTQARQRYAVRLSERILRLLAAEIGTSRLGVRSRPGEGLDEVVVAFVWRRRGRAQAAAQWLPELLTALLCDGLDQTLATATAAVLAAPVGEPPLLRTPRIPVASVTGTNGKTTTTRMLAHISMTAGRRTAWSSTDGVVVQGELVEPGQPEPHRPGLRRAKLAGAALVLVALLVALGLVIRSNLGSSNDEAGWSIRTTPMRERCMIRR